jgi:hypothetical protein
MMARNNRRRMLGEPAVGEVQPGDVHARLDHRSEGFARGTPGRSCRRSWSWYHAGSCCGLAVIAGWRARPAGSMLRPAPSQWLISSPSRVPGKFDAGDFRPSGCPIGSRRRCLSRAARSAGLRCPARGRAKAARGRAQTSAEALAGRFDQGCGADELLQLVRSAPGPPWEVTWVRGYHPGVPKGRQRDSGRDCISEVEERVQQVHGQCSHCSRHPAVPAADVPTLVPSREFRKRKSNAATLRAAIYIVLLANSEGTLINTVNSPENGVNTGTAAVRVGKPAVARRSGRQCAL